MAIRYRLTYTTSAISLHNLYNKRVFHTISEIFEKKNRNSLLLVEPPELKFTFTKDSKASHGKMKLHNISGKALRVVLLPPQSKYFSIDYKNKGCILPGLALTVDVKFAATEDREYSDWLKILCPGECNLMVPLQALPAGPFVDIPTKIDLGAVSLGEVVCGKFCIEPCPHLDMAFLIFLPAPSRDFTVQPLRGVVKHDDPPLEVLIKFCPTEYITVLFPIQLYIPDVSQSPFVITISAVSKPGIARNKLPEKREEVTKPQPQKYVAPKPVTAKQKKKKPHETAGGLDLNTPHGVVKFLLAKEPNKYPTNELLGPLGRTVEEDHAVWRAKKQQFQREVKQYRAENEAARIHRRDKPGQPHQIDSETTEQVLAERTALWEEYKSLLNSDGPLDETTGTTRQKRTLRRIDEAMDLTFTDTPNDMWFVRYQTLCRFIQAARRVIIQNRLLRRLQTLKENAREVIQQEEEQKNEELLENKHTNTDT